MITQLELSGRKMEADDLKLREEKRAMFIRRTELVTMS